MNKSLLKRSLNVLQILPSLGFGGVERGTVQITNALVDRGHKAFVVSGAGPLIEEVKQAGGTHFALNVGKKSPATLLLIPKLAQLFIKHNIDIVHSRSRLPAWLTMAALKFIPQHKRPTWFTTVHGPYSINFYSNVMNKGDHVIAVSGFMRDYVLKNYLFPQNKKISVIARGVEEIEYQPSFAPSNAWQKKWQDEIAYTPQAKLLTLAGRITRWKGQSEFIKLIAQVRANGIDAYGLIAGGVENKRSSYYTELKLLAKSLDVNDKIKFLGPRNDLKEILSISDCAYSLTNKPEAFGRTTVEALSLGTPVIGYDHGGTSEILREIFPSGIVPLHDLDKAVSLTVKFLTGAGNTSPIKPNSFTVSRMQNETIALYEKEAAY
jgi:glycosyltransferase involved in cell wall biosynthesis